MDKVIFWFRRDLRLDDNPGLAAALASGHKVMPVFIFDTAILDLLDDRGDPRMTYIHNAVGEIDRELRKLGSSLRVYHGLPAVIFQNLLRDTHIKAVYTNRDYEPYALERDRKVRDLCRLYDIAYHDFKDQVVFESDEVLKDDGTPYHVFTPYKRKWLARLQLEQSAIQPVRMPQGRFETYSNPEPLPELKDIGFRPSVIELPSPGLPSAEILEGYADTRNIPSIPTTRAGVHLRFGTVSIRQAMTQAREHSETWMSELIWREFFMQILHHYPRVVSESFRPEYDRIQWRNDEEDFRRWREGRTGFPLVDAGMRELLATGHMHNRVRMVVASFLVKDLLIDWRWGETWFASKLLDFELASNNGNWQWAAGTGCDAAPYFRVFNPAEQARKFDPEGNYIRRWVPEIDSPEYPAPMVDHAFARERALKTFKEGLMGETLPSLD